MDKALQDVIDAQRLSDAIYDLATVELNCTLEQAEVLSRTPNVVKNFKFSAGGSVLMFQNTPVMRSDKGERIRNYLEVNKYDFLLPPKVQTAAKETEIPEALLTAARAGHLTSQGEIFKLVHGNKPRTAEAESREQVKAILAGTDTAPLNPDLIADDRTRRAQQSAAKDHANNPWANTVANCDASGRYTANAIGRQAALVKASLAGASGIAASVGSKVGDVRAQRKVEAA